MTEASEDWMLDDDIGIMDDEDEETKKGETAPKELKVETKDAETAQKETKAEPQKKPFALPMTEASEDWMLDDDVGIMDDEDKETKKGETAPKEPKVETKDAETAPKETKAEPEKKPF